MVGWQERYPAGRKGFPLVAGGAQVVDRHEGLLADR